MTARRAPARRAVQARGVAAALVLALVAAACSRTTQYGATSSTDASALRWRSCGDALQCATLTVPLIAAQPRGRQIELALYRHRAESSRRIGSLLVNPGGPGESGRPVAELAGSLFPKALRDRFDIVAWDTRGTGASTAVRCGERLDAFYAVDRSGDSPAEVAANERAARDLAARCARGSGALLAHLATRDIVVDMDAIRAALGDPRLTYLGLSYGTYLGTRYALAYPTRVRALVLDGAVDPSTDAVTSTEQQSAGFEQSLQAFLSYCSTTTACPFHSGGDASSALHRLLAQIGAEPVFARTNGESRTLGPTEARIGIAEALYDGRPAWNTLASALADAASGDGSALLMLSDDYTERSRGGRYSTTQEAFYATSCLDEPETRADVQRSLRDALVHAPVLGPVNAWLGLPCAYWPVRPVDRPGRITAPAALPTVVVVSSTGDPATPYAWGVSLAHQLRARQLAVDTDTHTAFLDGGACIQTAVVAYLVTARAPAHDLRCARS